MSGGYTFRDALAERDAARGALTKIVEAKLLCEAENVRLREAMRWAMAGNPWRERFTALLDDTSPDDAVAEPFSSAGVGVDPSPDSPADKPCETCGGCGEGMAMEDGIPVGLVPCPSCRGGEPT